MPEDVSIEQMKPSDRDEVLAFLRKVYPDNPRQGNGEFWDWHFPDSPYANAGDLPLFIARVDGRLAGQAAALPVEFNVEGESVRAAWILDYIVDTDFRRRGIAKKLALALKDHYPYVFAVTTHKQHSTKLLSDIGWNVFTGIPRYQRILFPGNALREASRIAPVRGFANLIYSPLRRGFRTEEKVHCTNTFGSAFDRFWSKARDQWPCSITRNGSVLDWQFCRQPGKHFEIFGHLIDGELSGYAVMFFRREDQRGIIEKAAISDICYGPADPDRTIDSLLSACLDLAIKRRVGSVVTDVIDDRIAGGLRRAGFWRVNSDLLLSANVPEKRDVICDPANWFLTRADSDISIFEGPNL